jgi:hypothetical protein
VHLPVNTPYLQHTFVEFRPIFRIVVSDTLVKPSQTRFEGDCSSFKISEHFPTVKDGPLVFNAGYALH